MDVLDLGEAEISALGNGAGRVRSGMAADRHRRTALGIDSIGIEVGGEPGQPFLAPVIAPFLRIRNVAGQRVERLDRRDAMALSHHPGAGGGRERVRGKVADKGRHHVQGTAGMAFRGCFEGF